jgi:hypothetical protein
MQSPAEQGVRLDGIEAVSGVLGPVDFEFVVSAGEFCFAEAAGIGPVASACFDLITCGSQGGEVGVAGAHDFLFGVVKDVEVVTVTRGVIGCVEDHATGEMTGLAAVGGDDLEHVLLELG